MINLKINTICKSKGVKILKPDGTPFDHLGKEWKDATDPFKNFLANRDRKGISDSKQFERYAQVTQEDIMVWNETSGIISDLWDQYKVFIEKAKNLNKSPQIRGKLVFAWIYG